MSQVQPSEELHITENRRNNSELETRCNLNSSVEIKSEEVEDVKFNLEDLHHSIDIKDECDSELISVEQTASNYNEATLLECAICARKCKYRRSLIQHLKTHTGEKSFSCQKSEEVEDVKFNLEDLHHSIDIKDESGSELKSVEETNGSTLLECVTCARKYKYRRSLIHHLKMHTSKQSFSCQICGNKYNNKFSFKRHLRTHTDKKFFVCEICDYKSNCRSHLQNHLRTHTGEKPFSCEVCDYKCNQKSALKRHLTTHTDEKRFSCKICDYKSNEKAHLKRHLRIHTGKKLFSCHICGYGGNQKQHLKTHIMRRHTGKKANISVTTTST